MNKMKYAAAPGGPLTHKQAQIAGKELERISEKHGALKPAEVVNESRPKQAPLHPFFTWDDKKAAEKYREDEARSIIRSVVVVRPEIPIEEQPVVRAFVHVTANESETKFEGAAYLPISRVINQEDYRKQMVAQAQSELTSFKRRYDDILHFLGANDAIETIEKGLQMQLNA